MSDQIPVRVFAPFMVTAVCLALAYGSTFLLADALRAAGEVRFLAGSIISLGAAGSLTGALMAGRLATKTSILAMIVASTLAMAAAMACFAAAEAGGMTVAYAGGLLLGVGWAVFYMLAPIYLINCLSPASRVKAITLLSAVQMAGIGLSAPLGHLFANRFGGYVHAYIAYCALCSLAALALPLLTKGIIPQEARSSSISLTVDGVLAVLGRKTAAPVLMIGIAACAFSGLSTFQSVYAEGRRLSQDAFFLTFTVMTVVLRFSIASRIGRLPLLGLALMLHIVTLIGVSLFLANEGAPVMHLAASALFAAGYGLTYSTLNAMALTLAEECEISPAIASQVFTLGYFTGLFGFPFVAAKMIAHHGIDRALELVAAFIVLNLAVACFMLLRKSSGAP